MMKRDTLTRQRGTVTASSYGSSDIDWTTLTANDPMPAEVVSPASTEMVARAERVDAQYEARVDGWQDVKPTDRVVWRGNTYEVKGGVDNLMSRGVCVSLRFLIGRVTGG